MGDKIYAKCVKLPEYHYVVSVFHFKVRIFGTQEIAKDTHKIEKGTESALQID